MTSNQQTKCIVAFLRDVVGLTIREETLTDETFLPGLALQGGALVYDPKRLRYPGDLLHEAGHLAVIPAHIRHSDDSQIIQQALDNAEIAAIAWSYAAICHLELPIDVLFHPNGYKGQSQALQLSFSMGVFTGLPQLEDAGLAISPRKAASLGVLPYPAMLRWLCE
jgi:hypothetical protein